jgi:hypothetical protein
MLSYLLDFSKLTVLLIRTFPPFYSASSPDFLLEPKEVAYLCLRVERRLLFGCMTFMGFSPEGIAAAALA